ncbi:GntR family transcriptional regulator [Subtercola lobariae]|uniref:GntR family transcriptional regulator n=1 Tax=Subtercola lobariae TaxID=1588641 RepID=A0A917B231_9MICO|nr:GntR family transcriptional regulator [Subtercola lobariae]GGF16205.1 GntR family transcriptional regulator [Subtercola lobariae]
MPSPTAPSTRAAVVHDSIRADIISGALEPGTPLRLAALAASYDVSMSVVREALTRLAEHNLTVLAPNQGFRVMSISRADLVELTMLRTMLETKALALSIELGDVPWEAQVVSAHHVLERAAYQRENEPGSTEQWTEAHAAFHDALVGACDSPRLMTMTRSLRDSSELYRQRSGFAEASVGRDVAGEHRELMALTLAGKSAEAQAALVRHIERTTELVLSTPFADGGLEG